MLNQIKQTKKDKYSVSHLQVESKTSQTTISRVKWWVTEAARQECCLYPEDKERPKKEMDSPDGQVAGFNKQGNRRTSLVLGGCKMTRSLHLLARILKVYTEGIMGFSHISCPDGLNNTLLSQGCVSEMAPDLGTVGKAYIPRTGEEGMSLQLVRSSLRVNKQPYPLNALLHREHGEKSEDVGQRVRSCSYGE